MGLRSRDSGTPDYTATESWKAYAKAAGLPDYLVNQSPVNRNAWNSNLGFHDLNPAFQIYADNAAKQGLSSAYVAQQLGRLVDPSRGNMGELTDMQGIASDLTTPFAPGGSFAPNVKTTLENWLNPVWWGTSGANSVYAADKGLGDYVAAQQAAADDDGGLFGSLLSIASIIPSPIQPWAMAVNAAYQASEGNYLAAILSAAGANAAFSGVDATVLADAKNLADQGLSLSQISDTIGQTYGMNAAANFTAAAGGAIGSAVGGVYDAAVKTLLGSVGAGALTGALSSAITGGDPLKGALTGGIGGAFSGGDLGFMASDAASLAETGLSASQIANTLQQTYGVSGGVADALAGIGSVAGSVAGASGGAVDAMQAADALLKAAQGGISSGVSGGDALTGALVGGTGSLAGSAIGNLNLGGEGSLVDKILTQTAPSTAAELVRTGDVNLDNLLNRLIGTGTASLTADQLGGTFDELFGQKAGDVLERAIGSVAGAAVTGGELTDQELMSIAGRFLPQVGALGMDQVKAWWNGAGDLGPDPYGAMTDYLNEQTASGNMTEQEALDAMEQFNQGMSGGTYLDPSTGDQYEFDAGPVDSVSDVAAGEQDLLSGLGDTKADTWAQDLINAGMPESEAIDYATFLTQGGGITDDQFKEELDRITAELAQPPVTEAPNDTTQSDIGPATGTTLEPGDQGDGAVTTPVENPYEGIEVTDLPPLDTTPETPSTVVNPPSTTTTNTAGGGSATGTSGGIGSAINFNAAQSGGKKDEFQWLLDNLVAEAEKAAAESAKLAGVVA